MKRLTWMTLAIANGLTLLLTLFWILFQQRLFIPIALIQGYGFLLLSTLALNPVLPPPHGRFEQFETFWLLFNSVNMLLIPLLLTGASLSMTDLQSVSEGARLLVLVLVLSGTFRSAIYTVEVCRLEMSKTFRPDFRALQRKGPDFASLQRGGLVFSRIQHGMVLGAGVILILLLSTGLIVAHAILAKEKQGILDVFIPEYGFFLGSFYLTLSMLFIRTNRPAPTPSGRRNQPGFFHRLLHAFVVLYGLGIMAICLLPLLSAPKMILDAESEVHRAFGTSISTMESSSFRRSPFLLTDLVFGVENGPCTVTEDLIYLVEPREDGSQTILRYDLWLPEGADKPMEGWPVFIRIHGGAWTIGDKGLSNFTQENKYFAAQGYAVFDIQYGLSDMDAFVEGAPVRTEVTGPHDIDDMMRHIGAFTRHLADNAEQAGLDMDRVFFGGGSAGGQLALAAGWGIASGQYPDLLDERLHVRGIVAHYPAIGLSATLGIGGSPQWVDPTLLLQENMPPVLVYQGTRDSLVRPEVAKRLSTACLEAGTSCAVLWMPYASHGSNMAFSGPYQQVFLYHSERFMAHFGQ